MEFRRVVFRAVPDTAPLRYISLERSCGATNERNEEEFSLRGGTQNGAHSPADAGYARA